jgi:hypothetical protein
MVRASGSSPVIALTISSDVIEARRAMATLGPTPLAVRRMRKSSRSVSAPKPKRLIPSSRT